MNIEDQNDGILKEEVEAYINNLMDRQEKQREEKKKLQSQLDNLKFL